MTMPTKSLFTGLGRFVQTAALGLAVATAGLLAPSAAPAQTFEEADWFEREIGDGVVWRAYEFDNLFGVRQSISYLEIDLTNPNVEVELPYLATGIQRTSQLVPNQFPDALGAVNGTYFNTSDPGHNTYLRIDGTEIPHKPRTKGAWGHHGAIAQDGADDWAILEMPTTGGEWDDELDHPNLMANGPLLILDGSIAQAQIDSAGGTHCTGRHPRTAVGITADDRLILLAADGRTDRATGLTCNETAEVLLMLDVVDALNMDGGGTTTMWVTGEPQSGVVNYPSDGSGERGTPNAIAVIAPPAAPAAWDARLLSMTFDNLVEPEDSQTVTLVYENVGTETWTAADTRLITARPTEEDSDLAHESWVSDSQPALMDPATVAPGETGTFSFTVVAPASATAETYTQYFLLDQDGVGRIGPHDGKARLRITAIPMEPVGDTFIVHTRAGGPNYLWYSDDPDFANSTATATPPGATGGIGSRWTSSYTSVVGVRSAEWKPDFPESGEYNVAVSWPDAGSNRRDPIRYYVDHDGGRSTFDIDQTAPGNAWYPLGNFFFSEGQSDDGRVIMTNEVTDQSGNMWAGPVRFINLDAPTSVEDWNLY